MYEFKEKDLYGRYFDCWSIRKLYKFLFLKFLMRIWIEIKMKNYFKGLSGLCFRVHLDWK